MQEKDGVNMCSILQQQIIVLLLRFIHFQTELQVNIVITI